MDDLESRIAAVNNQMFVDTKDETANLQSPEEIAPAPQPVDLYKDFTTKRYEMRKRPLPNGSRPKVTISANAVLQALAPAYKKAKDDSDVLSSRGDKQRAEIIKQQYVQEEFLPAVEAVITMNSVDEVLGNKDVLAKFDEYAVLDGSGKGYTESYIRTSHEGETGSFSGMSDGIVREELRKIRALIDSDQIRSAYGMARQIKEKIDNGNNIASPEDYEYLQRIVLRGQ